VQQQAKQYAAQRLALIGDAAHRMHPLAGQALNTSITDAAYLANALISAKNVGGDIGDYELCLKDFEKKSMTNANLLIAAIEFIRNVYESKFMGSEVLGHALSLMRNIGIEAVESSEVAKYNFMNYAAGNATHPTSYEWQE